MIFAPIGKHRSDARHIGDRRVEAAEFVGASLRRRKCHDTAIAGWIFAQLRKLLPLSKSAAFPGTL
jgi:hypothetical protein